VAKMLIRNNVPEMRMAWLAISIMARRALSAIGGD
jgi:hypothetical protein